MFADSLALALVMGLLMHRSLDLWAIRTKIASLVARPKAGIAASVTEQWYREAIVRLSTRFDLIAAASLYAAVALLLGVGVALGNGHMKVDFEQPVATSIGILFSLMVSVLNGQYEHLRAQLG